MRELRRQALLVAQARGQAVQQPVEGEGEPGELVVGLTQGEASLEIPVTPLPGRLLHSPLDLLGGHLGLHPDARFRQPADVGLHGGHQHQTKA
ncbi:MAG: hypothetical protein ACR2QA_14650 [Solirubrobacteraceae bacterium]